MWTVFFNLLVSNKLPWDDHGKTDECVFYKSKRCKFVKHAGKFTMATVIVIHLIVSLARIFLSEKEWPYDSQQKKHIVLCKPCQPNNGNFCFENTYERHWFVHHNFQEATKITSHRYQEISQTSPNIWKKSQNPHFKIVLKK